MDRDNCWKYGRALRNHRERCDLTMGDLADHMLVSASFVSDIELGRNPHASEELVLMIHDKVYQLWLARNPSRVVSGDDMPEDGSGS